MGYPVSEANVCPFTDVDRPLHNLYPDNYIAVAAARGITVGLHPGLFAPWNDISSAQLITMVARAAEFGDLACLVYASDSPTSRTHTTRGPAEPPTPVCSAAYKVWAPVYDFWAPATRGEVCVLLYNLVESIGVTPSRHVAAASAAPLPPTCLGGPPTHGPSVGYSVPPTTQGANSSSPSPSASDFVRRPEAVSNIRRKIRPPACSTVSEPSRMVPQSTSMSSCMCR